MNKKARSVSFALRILFGIGAISTLPGCMTGESTFQEVEVDIEIYPGLYSAPHDVEVESQVGLANVLKLDPGPVTIRLDSMGAGRVSMAVPRGDKRVTFIVRNEVANFLETPLFEFVEDTPTGEDKGARICLSLAASVVNARAKTLRPSTSTWHEARIRATNELQSALGLSPTAESYREACLSYGDVEVVRQAIAVSHAMSFSYRLGEIAGTIPLLLDEEIDHFAQTGRFYENSVSKLKLRAGQIDGAALETRLESHFAMHAPGLAAPRVAQAFDAMVSGVSSADVCDCGGPDVAPLPAYASMTCGGCECPPPLCDLSLEECGTVIPGLSGTPSSAIKLWSIGQKFVALIGSDVVGFGELAGRVAGNDARLIAASGLGEIFTVPATGSDWAHYYASIEAPPAPVSAPSAIANSVECFAASDVNRDGKPEIISTFTDDGRQQLNVTQSNDWRTPGNETHIRVDGFIDVACSGIFATNTDVYIQQGSTLSIIEYDGTTYSLTKLAEVDPDLQISVAGNSVIARSPDGSRLWAFGGGVSADWPFCVPTGTATAFATSGQATAWVHEDPADPTRVLWGSNDAKSLVPMATNGWTWVAGDSAVIYTDAEGQIRYLGF